jgi:NAD(P)-dependent dehydrogenase (short-subunit alcohol dehydrogenase family)
MAEGNIRFDGRAIVVTGAGRGLGRAQALLLASRGASVVVSDNGAAKDGEDPSTGPAASVVAEIQAAGGKAVACTADLSTDEGATAAVQACLDAFGRIDGIAHYASSCPPLKSPDQLSTRDLELVMRINAGAAMWMARAAWPHMARAGYGRIVLTTSGGAYGARNNADYSSAKAAQIGLTRCLAVDGAEHGILVNAVAPSAHTRMTDGFFPGKFADWFAEIMAPEKVAASAAYLLDHRRDIRHGRRPHRADRPGRGRRRGRRGSFYRRSARNDAARHGRHDLLQAAQPRRTLAEGRLDPRV